MIIPIIIEISEENFGLINKNKGDSIVFRPMGDVKNTGSFKVK